MTRCESVPDHQRLDHDNAVHYHDAMTNPPLRSTLTDRYQTTIPEAVRQHLGLSKRDEIQYLIEDDGSVRLLGAASEDPALRPFLALLARDLSQQPERLEHLDSPFQRRLSELTADAEIDLDAALDPENE